jgi:sec-independent protein translocase protein TatA
MWNMTFAYFTSYTDWLIVGGIILVLFGGAKIPQLAKGLGEGIREFKKSVNGEEDETPKVEEKKADESDEHKA